MSARTPKVVVEGHQVASSPFSPRHGERGREVYASWQGPDGIQSVPRRGLRDCRRDLSSNPLFHGHHHVIHIHTYIHTWVWGKQADRVSSPSPPFPFLFMHVCWGQKMQGSVSDGCSSLPILLHCHQSDWHLQFEMILCLLLLSLQESWSSFRVLYFWRFGEYLYVHDYLQQQASKLLANTTETPTRDGGAPPL